MKTHRRENNPQSEQILRQQNPRLRGNNLAIFIHLLKGHKFNGYTASDGVRLNNSIRFMLEYRRRIKDLKDIGVIMSETTSQASGLKTWYMTEKQIKANKKKFAKFIQ